MWYLPVLRNTQKNQFSSYFSAREANVYYDSKITMIQVFIKCLFIKCHLCAVFQINALTQLDKIMQDRRSFWQLLLFSFFSLKHI